jgi:hypothetical protein
VQLPIFRSVGKVVLTAVLLICGVSLPLEDAAARRARPGPARLTGAQRQARKTAITLVKQGVGKLREGDYVAALELFSKAYKIYPSPKIQFNIGQTYKELGRYLDAIGAYEKFEQNAPLDTSEALRKLARDNVRELFRKIALLRVQVSLPGARISIDGQPRGVSPLGKPLRLMPGVHSMVVKKQGYVTAVVDLRLRAGKRITRTVTLHRPRSKVVQVIWKSMRKPKKGLPVLWTGVALTGAAALVAAITGGLALVEEKRKDDLDLPIADRRAAATRGKRYVLTTDGLLLGAGVVALSSLIWYLAVVRPSGGTERVRVGPTGGAVVPHVSPGGGGLTVRF